MAVHNDLLEVLVCPACKGELKPFRGFGAASAHNAAATALDCPHCRLRFPIVDDIPVMLLDQAERIAASN
jgi:uncharacterized protein YbaR (Trm112 family)